MEKGLVKGYPPQPPLTHVKTDIVVHAPAIELDLIKLRGTIDCVG